VVVVVVVELAGVEEEGVQEDVLGAVKHRRTQ